MYNRGRIGITQDTSSNQENNSRLNQTNVDREKPVKKTRDWAMTASKRKSCINQIKKKKKCKAKRSICVRTALEKTRSTASGDSPSKKERGGGGAECANDKPWGGRREKN